jgi:hypothetical protein
MALYAATISQINELTGRGVQRRLPTDEAIPTPDTAMIEHPIIPGSPEFSPQYMSLNAAQSIALGLQVEASNIRRQREHIAATAYQHRHERYSTARDARQQRINRILQLAPSVRGEIDVALHSTNAAFSCDSNGRVTDPADAILAAIESRVTELHRQACNPVVATTDTTDSTNLDAATAALTRHMR